MKIKKLLLPFIALFSVIPSVLAVDLSPLTNALNTFTRFVFVDLSSALGEEILIRVLLWILLFTVFYAVLMNLNKQKSPFAKKNFAMPIAMVVALMASIFMPQNYVFLIAHGYSFVSSFLLLAVPVVAIVYLNHAIFPTSEEKEKDVGKRRLNHGAKGLLYYFLALLLQNYTNAIGAAKPYGFTEVFDFTISICMFLFIYHIIMALFSSGESEKGPHEGWFEGMPKPPQQPEPPKQSAPKQKEGREEKSQEKSSEAPKEQKEQRSGQPKKLKLKITGRAVYDSESLRQKIGTDRSGSSLFDDNFIVCPNDKFVVGVMAQIDGELKLLKESAVAAGSRGRFTVEFEADPSQFEKLTELPKKVEGEILSGVDLSKVQAGVLVYAVAKFPNTEEQDMYLHIVKFDNSLAGRGGFGMVDPQNRCSIYHDRSFKFSGIPIAFSESHVYEINVIVPVVLYPSQKKKLEEAQKSEENQKKAEQEKADRLKRIKEELQKLKEIPPEKLDELKKVMELNKAIEEGRL